MKKKLVAAALILLLICGMAGGTTAFYTTIGEATNVITTGGIDVALQEWADEDGTPFEDVIHVLPTQEVTKIVTAKNVGPNAAWVRMRLEKTLQLAEGVEGEADPDLVRAMKMHPASDLQQALQMAEALLGRKGSITVIPEGISTIIQ